MAKFVIDAAIAAIMADLDVSVADFKNMRKWYKTAFGKATTLDDDDIRYVMAAAKDDHDHDGWAKAMKDHETALATAAALPDEEEGAGEEDGEEADTTDATVAAGVSARKVDSGIAAIADKLAGDAAFMAELTGMVVKKEQSEVGCIPVMWQMVRVLGVEQMNAFPRGNSKPEDVKGTNRPSDHYERKATIDGKRRKIKGRVLYDLADELPVIKAHLAAIEKAKHDKNTTKKMGVSEYGDIIGYNKGRVNYYRGYVVKAIDCYHNLTAIEGMTKVEAMLKTEDDNDNKLMPGREPFKVQSTDTKKERDKCTSLTVTQFLSLKPDVAIANGGTYDALIDTMDRSGNAGSGEEDAIENYQEFEAVTLRWLTYLNGPSGYETAKLWLKRNPAKRGAMLLTLQDVSDNAEGLLADYTTELATLQKTAGKKTPAIVAKVQAAAAGTQPAA